jgi:hypothetical protein
MFAITTTVSNRCPLCGKTIPRGKERLIIETDDPPRKVHVEVCGRCVAREVLAAIARRVACEGRMDDTRTADGADQNIDARTIDAAGAGSAPAGSEIS